MLERDGMDKDRKIIIPFGLTDQLVHRLMIRDLGRAHVALG